MAYIYKRAVAALRNGINGLQPVDIIKIKLNDLFADYVAIQIVVTNPVFKKDYVINTDKYFTDMSSFNGTIVDWLSVKGEEAIEVFSTLPGSELGYVVAGDLQLNNYRIFPGDHLSSADDQKNHSAGSAPDIRAVHTTLTPDYDDLAKSGLFTVNGHFVRAMGFKDGLYFIGAGKNYLINNNVHVNCLDFSNLGSLTTTPFKKENVNFIDQDGYSGLHIDIPNYDDTKTLWFVVGGRLYLGNELIKRIGETTFKFNIHLVNLPNKLFESLDYIDLNPALDKSRQLITEKEFFSNDFLLKLLLNDNSFYIVIDKPFVGVTLEELTTYTYPTTFRSDNKEHHPLMLDNGLFPAYIPRYQDNVMLMDVDIRLKPKRVNDLTGVDNGGNLFHNAVSMFRPHDLVKGYFFKIHTLKDES